MMVEIYMGNIIRATICDPKRIETSIDGVFVKITDLEGNTFETSPHNVLILGKPKGIRAEKGGEE